MADVLNDNEFLPLAGRRVYLSGPMTGWPDKNSKAFEEAERIAYSLGAKGVYNPVTHTKSVDWTEREQFLHYDLRILLDCDAVVQLEDWNRSWGAARELEVAITCGIDVFLLESLVAGRDAWVADELSRCPRCGGSAALVGAPAREGGPVRWHAQCGTCGHGSDGVRLITRSDAAIVWNAACRDGRDA